MTKQNAKHALLALVSVLLLVKTDVQFVHLKVNVLHVILGIISLLMLGIANNVTILSVLPVKIQIQIV